MIRIGQTQTTRQMLWTIPALLSLTLIGGVGCSFATDQVLPRDLQTRIASHGTADDHIAAALLYQQQADQAQTEADQYKQAAASIKPLEDPKGFRRSALITAAQTHQLYAGEMQQLYAAHQTKAETMLGKQQPQ
ncbi:MAG: hypothetical protein OJF47_001615 [Nitrospira sp.]|nr:MAG: hypothetical protein OJF47_001611 [Nitrospira sp.]WHZ22503.1 MAG: hypothetical protein OJF47_001615 [Nitrospira sp.]